MAHLRVLLKTEPRLAGSLSPTKSSNDVSSLQQTLIWQCSILRCNGPDTEVIYRADGILFKLDPYQYGSIKKSSSTHALVDISVIQGQIHRSGMP